MCKLMESYPGLSQRLFEYRLSDNVIYKVSTPGSDKVKTYGEKYKQIRPIIGQVIECFNEDDKLIMKSEIIDILRKEDPTIGLSSNGKIVSVGVIMKVKFYDYDCVQYGEMNYCDKPYDNEIMTAIENDDADTLQNIITAKGLEACDRVCFLKREYINLYSGHYIQWNYSSAIYHMRQKHVSIIDYILLCGAVKCFKYVFLSFPELTDPHDQYTNIEQFAILGGNIEIIKILENDYKPFDKEIAFRAIIATHNMDLFKYWYHRYEIKLKPSIVCQMIEFYNFEAIDYLKTMKTNIHKFIRMAITARSTCYNIELLIHLKYYKNGYTLHQLSTELIKYVLENNLKIYPVEHEYGTLLWLLVARGHSFSEVKEILSYLENKHPSANGFTFIEECAEKVGDELYDYLEFLGIDDYDMTAYPDTHRKKTFKKWYFEKPLDEIDPRVVKYIHDKANEYKVSRKKFENRNAKFVGTEQYKIIFELMENLDMFK